MDVLANAIGIVPGHDRFEFVAAGLVRLQAGAVTIAVEIVMAQMIGLPDLESGIGKRFGASTENLAGDDERHAGIVWRAQHRGVGRALLVKRTNLVGRGRTLVLRLMILKGREHRTSR